LLAFINAQAWLFSLPNPLQVREWARGMGYRVKSDRIDGRKLVQLGGSSCMIFRNAIFQIAPERFEKSFYEIVGVFPPAGTSYTPSRDK